LSELLRLDLQLELDALGLLVPIPRPQCTAKLGHQATMSPMLETKAFVGCPERDPAHPAAGSLLKPLGQAEEIGARDPLAESVVRTNLATDKGHPDVPMYAGDPIRLVLDPR
jgi:hypothetical protein